MQPTASFDFTLKNLNLSWLELSGLLRDNLLKSALVAAK